MCVCVCVCGGYNTHPSLQGITFNPNRLVVPTKKAHILLAEAAKEGKQHALQEVSGIYMYWVLELQQGS